MQQAGVQLGGVKVAEDVGECEGFGGGCGCAEGFGGEGGVDGGEGARGAVVWLGGLHGWARLCWASRLRRGVLYMSGRDGTMD